jgi:hypothetical protein
MSSSSPLDWALIVTFRTRRMAGLLRARPTALDHHRRPAHAAGVVATLVATWYGGISGSASLVAAARRTGWCSACPTTSELLFALFFARRRQAALYTTPDLLRVIR